MARKRKTGSPKINLARDLWISPRSNLRGPDGSRAWDNHGNVSSDSGARFLELADIALGLKKPIATKKKAVAALGGAHQATDKAEPYSAGTEIGFDRKIVKSTTS